MRMANCARIPCSDCDDESADGVHLMCALMAGWTDVSEAIGNRSAWWDHIGLCPDCSPGFNLREGGSKRVEQETPMALLNERND